ncbi:hypothetical protein [Nocardioides sp. SYSU DS0663]|uniref:hypothetical protein n=1 Tax=Nocardioides sp. SYSU DS0663 TaxID=3416445 RepID=UPI003F4BE628
MTEQLKPENARTLTDTERLNVVRMVLISDDFAERLVAAVLAAMPEHRPQAVRNVLVASVNDALQAERREAPHCAPWGRLMDRRTWEQRVPGTDVPTQQIHLEVDAEGRVRLHEALVCRLLNDAGWERRP